ncbi:flagellar filament capping protein FliD [Rhodanobacter sp. C06]|uniref:flagellar filament capping protein FliD n=1 Tax=Rhodanobacter sp. C06 TaxID=1945854 RepID=UPI000987B5F3|nr:flagellar filament capping protein FliD [Rhodanobacter sp. C06]
MTSISGVGTTTTGTGSSAGSGLSSTNSPGSGLLSSAGIGSGLDVNAIITALVNAKQAGPSQQISNQTTQLQAQEAGLTALGSALNSLQTTLGKLGSSLTFNSYTATLGDSMLGTTSTLPNAQPGTYNLTVNHLATAQKRASTAYASGSAVGAGTLTVSVGNQSMNLNVSATDSISTIATAINQSSGNPGVQATIVNGTNGAQLLLTSTKTGVANAFSVSAGSGSSAGLSALATTLNTAGSNEASDASLSIDGIAVTSASNAVSGALNGVTLNLSATGSTTLTVSQDTSGASGAVSDFVNAYNSYISTVGTLSSYDPTSKQGGVLLGDTTLMSVQRQVNSMLSSSVAGNSIGSLAALGITRNADGTLSSDSGKLSSALQSNPGAVQDLFAGTNGYATRLNSMLDGFTSSNGILATRTASIQNQLSNLSQESTALTARMNVYATQLRQQYTALDTLMSSLNNTSSYLTSSLQAMLNSNSSNK